MADAPPPTPPPADEPWRDMARSYQRHVVPAIGAPVAELLIDATRPGPGESVVDVACGTGVASRTALDAVGSTGRVVGVDPTTPMLEVAREVSPPDIEWVEAPADDLPLPDSSVDLALCSLGMQFFPDRVAALREMHRVLVPGGRVGWCTPGPTPEPYGVIEAALERHVGQAPASFVAMVFSLHDADGAREETAAAGFDRVDVRTTTTQMRMGPTDEFLWSYLGSTPTAMFIAPLDQPVRDAIEAEVVAGCAPFLDGNDLVVEASVQIVTGHRAA